MMPPKTVPRALVSLGIRTTRMAGWRGPAVGVAVSSMVLFSPGRPLARRFRTGLSRRRFSEANRPRGDVSLARCGSAGRGHAGTNAWPQPSCYPTGPGMNPTSSPNPLESMNDAALLRLVADRQPEALGVLYNRYASTVLALGKRILGSLADAEEVLQEVFLYAWNHAGRYDAGRSSVSTWLVLVARSRAIDRLRTRKVVERTHETAHQEAPPEHASPEGVET